MNRSTYKRCKKKFSAYFTVPLEITFKQFRLGLALFFCGLVIIYGASQLLPPSLQQELTVLAGLLTGGCGFAIAMLSQLRMTVSRVWHFFNRNK
jgi:hypothetical protein